MSERGVVYDLGYVPYEGDRLGRAAAMRAVVGDGVRRVLGLRRKARKKILPWAVVVIATLPAIVIVGLSVFLQDFEGPQAGEVFGGHPETFSFIGTVVVLFTALAAPELLVPDREEGVLAVYSSRPLRARDYLLARAAALGTVIGLLLLIPQLLMYVGFAALSSEGLASALIGNADDLVQVGLTIGAYIFGYGGPALLVATYAKRLGRATGTYLAIMFALQIIADVLSEAGSSLGKYAALISLRQHPSVVRDWIFDRTSRGHAMTEAGWSPWVALLIILVVAGAAVVIASRRYRSEI